MTGGDGADVFYGGFSLNTFEDELDGEIDQLYFRVISGQKTGSMAVLATAPMERRRTRSKCSMNSIRSMSRG